MLYKLSLIALLFGGMTAHAQDRIFVRPGAQGANNGQNWANAYTVLQQALAAALAGDTVWVAAGEYRPTTDGDRLRSFAPRSGVRLFGGFAGTESQLSERDWRAHPSVLSGDLGIQGDSADNTYNVLYLDNPDSSTVVDGFFVQHGCADYLSNDLFAKDRKKSGGGLYVMGEDGDAYADIRNCVFRYNDALSFGGGAMVNGAGAGSVACRFLGCEFEQNRSRLDGGGLYRLGSGWVDRYPLLGYGFNGNVEIS